MILSTRDVALPIGLCFNPAEDTNLHDKCFIAFMERCSINLGGLSVSIQFTALAISSAIIKTERGKAKRLND
jgi:hypothetical protein